MRIIFPEPPYLFVVAKIQNPLNNVAGVFFLIYGLGVNIPKKLRPEFHTPYYIKKTAEMQNEPRGGWKTYSSFLRFQPKPAP